MSSHVDRDAFVARTVDWINRTIAPAGVVVDADTLLFETGLVTSIGILKLIAWTEHATGQRIPDASVRMDNFSTVRRIAAVFATETGGSSVAA